jgi:hypothetical protein
MIMVRLRVRIRVGVSFRVSVKSSVGARVKDIVLWLGKGYKGNTYTQVEHSH